MSQRQAVIYTARNKQQAHLLRNLLEEAGIEAAVTGDLLADGTGVDAVGWATAARVVVAEEDAKAARRLAEEFDRRGATAAAAARPDVSPEGPTELAEWPSCPECGARRTTTCPICHTSGTDFPQADWQFTGSPEPGDGATPVSCGCGSEGCSSREAKTGDEPAQAEAGAADVAEADGPGETAQEEPPAPRLVLTCTTCDEPFEPQFLKRCEWCGHEFPEGLPVDVAEGPPEEEITTRAIVVMIALGVLALGTIAYFLFLIPGK
jgi:hypothetical protein